MSHLCSHKNLTDKHGPAIPNLHLPSIQTNPRLSASLSNLDGQDLPTTLPSPTSSDGALEVTLKLTCHSELGCLVPTCSCQFPRIEREPLHLPLHVDTHHSVSSDPHWASPATSSLFNSSLLFPLNVHFFSSLLFPTWAHPSPEETFLFYLSLTSLPHFLTLFSLHKQPHRRPRRRDLFTSAGFPFCMHSFTYCLCRGLF